MDDRPARNPWGRPILDPQTWGESERAFRHAEQQHIVVDKTRHIKAVIRCNQVFGDSSMCDWTRAIEAVPDEIEDAIGAALGMHLLGAHHLDVIEAAKVINRKSITLRDIGG